MKTLQTIQSQSWIERARKLLRWLLFSACVLSILLALIYLFGGRYVGALHARFDIWQGNYEIHGYGLRLGISYKVKMLADHGIVYRQVAGCMVNIFIMKSTAAYNAVMKRAIKQNIGLDVDNLIFSAKDIAIPLIPH